MSLNHAHPIEHLLQELITLRATMMEDQVTDTEYQRLVARNKELYEHHHSCTEDDVVGHFITTPDGTLLSCNQRCARMVGCGSIEDALLYPGQQLFPASFLQEANGDIMLPHQQHECPWSEIELRRNDGSTVPVLVYVQGIFNEQGTLIAYTGRLIDHSDWKGKLEAQMRQSQKMEMLGRLAGSVVHDFNNLVTAITGYSDLVLADRDTSDSIRSNIRGIKKAGERAAALTRQLLAFSRREQRQPQPLSVNAVIVGMEMMLRRLLSENIELTVVTSPAVGTVYADQTQIEQVLMNLVVNAHEAMPEGGTLTIETSVVELDHVYIERHAVVRPGTYMRLAVSDTGCGMDMETQAHLFEPFFTTKSDGTGLGMATVYDSIKQSNGYIWTYSELDLGTTFKIYLPCDRNPIAASPDSTPFTPLQQGSETILLAEDDSTVREIAAAVLQQQGYTVLEAEDGDEALRLYQQSTKPIHLLVTDLVMPYMSGPELVKQLRTICPELRVLYITGYTDHAVNRLIGLGKDIPLLEKPFTADVLAHKVRKILDDSPSAID